MSDRRARSKLGQSKWIQFFATAGFVGLIPKAPGTFGTLVAIPIAYLLARGGPNFYLIATGVLIAFSIWISEMHERQLGTHDSKQIVIDEVVGYLVAFAWLPMTWMSFAAAFVIFRFFDILKPYPISVLDARVRGGLGVVVDDLAAGLIANILLQIVASKTTWLGTAGGTFLVSDFQTAIVEMTRLLRAAKARVSFAESCTGGLVSARLAALPGVSDIYNGAVVSYANEVKIDLLSVPAELLARVGAVSREVALAMAQGAKKNLRSDWAASITGIAGPSGGTAQKPVGTVCFALVGPSFEETFAQRFLGDRAAIQDQSARFVIEALVERLKVSLDRTT